MVLYGLKTCDACRAARKTLPEARFVDIRTDGLPDAVLDAALAAFGDALVNRRSTTWRGLDPAERARPPRDVLRAHPSLMKRPLIVAEGTMTLGWDSAARAAHGLG